jgi:hypothetical protein
MRHSFEFKSNLTFANLPSAAQGGETASFNNPAVPLSFGAGRAETPKGLALPLTLSGNRLQQQRFTDLGSVFPDVHSDW